MSDDSQQLPGNGQAVDPQALMAQVLFVMVKGMAPPGTTDDAVAQALDYAIAMEDKPEFALAFERIYEDDKVAARPRWGIKLHHATVGTHLYHAPKRLGVRGNGTDKPEDVSAFALSYGCFTSPALRAVLALHGYRIEFIEIAIKDKPQIIV